ncbi:MAG: hypothetical protein E7A50_05100 [Clostridiales bacterium]|nr:hypothetical protein [Clostridiales bacterium]
MVESFKRPVNSIPTKYWATGLPLLGLVKLWPKLEKMGCGDLQAVDSWYNK